MSDTTIGLAGIAILFLLLVIRIPVAFAMFVVGFIGIWLLNGWNAAMGLLASETFTLASKPELVVVPLFILMGNVASVTGMSRQLYEAAYAFVGSVRGGLASATVIGCGGFAALSGSSVAAALTMGKVSLAEMDRYKYDPRLSTGVVAAGGTLGILIPPSTGFVIYAILTEQSIGRLFLAGVLPGLLLLAIFVLTITLLCLWRPELGPPGPRTTMGQKRRALAGALPILTVIILTIGGIYGGFFSPTEAAGVGAGLVILYGVVTRTLGFRDFWAAVRDSVVTTATVMLILIAAHLLNPFLALSHVPSLVGEAITALDLSVLGTLAIILVVYLDPRLLSRGLRDAGPHVADLLPGRSPAGHRSDLVRRARRAHARDGADLASGGAERLHREVGRPEGAARPDLPGRPAVLAGDAGDARHPHRLPADLADPSRHHVQLRSRRCRSCPSDARLPHHAGTSRISSPASPSR
jgi:tripartite ATP-independent transporter DctM subunit